MPGRADKREDYRSFVGPVDQYDRFDFVLAHGVATSTGPSLLPRLLEAIEQTLAPTTRATSGG